MLVTKEKYETGNIVSFKLVNGDELVGRIIQEDSNHYILDKPLAVVPMQEGIRLVPAMFSADPETEFELSKDHVMLHNHTVETLADHYREVTGGIKAVRKGGIIV
jgi:hypothetical protein